ADHAIPIAGGLEIDWASPGNSERVADGFVTVGVGQYKVILGDNPVPDDLVRGAGSAQYVKGPVRAEDAGRIALRVSRRSDMVEPRTQRCRRDTQVGAQ